MQLFSSMASSGLPKDLNDVNTLSKTGRRRGRTRLSLILTSLILVILLLSMATISPPVSTISCLKSAVPEDSHRFTSTLRYWQTAIEPTDCGSTVEQALSNNCKFDPISFSWLTPACYDGELIDTFLASGNRHWYLHPSNSTFDQNPVPFEEVSNGTFDHLWVSREFHLFHCTYQWRKMHRAILAQRPVDGYIGNFTHTEHCEHILTRDGAPEKFDVVDVRIARKFATCGKKDYSELYRASG